MITIPTITELYNQIKSDLETEWGDSIPIFGKNFLRAVAMVQAGKLRIYYLAIANLQKNIFVDTADPEASGGTLERFGRIKLGRNPFPAQAGQYTIELTGDGGTVIPQGTTWKSNDDSLNPGKLFVLDVAHVMAGATDTLTIRALQAGEDSRLEIGDIVSITAPIANLDRDAEVTVETVDPFAAEEIEDYRRKAEDSFRTETEGGAAGDYRDWAADAQGVEKVYPYAKSGSPGEIDLYVEATIADSTDGKGTPSAGLLSDVEDVIELDPDTTKPINARGRRPLTVLDVHVQPINVLEVDIVINDYVGITAEKQAAILATITEALSTVRPFVAAADIVADRNDYFDVNKIVSLILSAQPGSVFGAVTMSVDGTPETSHTFTYGDIPHLNSITYA